MDYNASSIYEEMKMLLKSNLNEVAYESWFRDLKAVAVEDNVLILEPPSEKAEITKTIIESRYANVLLDCLKQLNYDLTFRLVEPDSFKPKEDTDWDTLLSERQREANLFSRHTFDQFVEGATNRLAYAASVAVAEMPGHTYNPLFIWGASGLGKTHLMHAIGNHILANDKKMEKKVLYITCETFTNELVASIQKHSTPRFREKYRQVDVLLIDDIQFLGGKTETQEEFFHTFNTLYDSGKQIVISGDRPPEAIDHLADRLLTRFRWGMIADIKLPDYETRLAILKKKVDSNIHNIYKKPFDDGALSFIANKISSNIRELEGALTQVAAFSSLQSSSPVIDESIAREALRSIPQSGPAPITMYRILDAVCEQYHVGMDEIKSKKRSKEIAYPRQIAMYLCRQLTDESLSSIGAELGGKDHTTVLHGCNKVEEDLKGPSGEELRRKLDDIQKWIKGE